MKKNLKTFAAHVFNALVVVVILFQIALAFGVSWGELTWGGKFPGVLPAHMRGVCNLSALLLIAFALVVSVSAGLLLPSWQQISKEAHLVCQRLWRARRNRQCLYLQLLGESHLAAGSSRSFRL